MSYWRLRPFHVQDLYFLAFVNVLTSHTFISCSLRTVLRHIPSFLDGYERFTLNPSFLDGYERFTSPTFISWRFRTFHVKTLSFLTITNVSRLNPCFLGGYKRFFVKNSFWFNERRFLPNPIIPLLFPSLLLTYNAHIGWDEVSWERFVILWKFLWYLSRQHWCWWHRFSRL